MYIADAVASYGELMEKSHAAGASEAMIDGF